MNNLSPRLEIVKEKLKWAFKALSSEMRLPDGWAKGPAIAVGVLALFFLGYFGYDSQSGYGWAVDVFVPVILKCATKGDLTFPPRFIRCNSKSSRRSKRSES